MGIVSNFLFSQLFVTPLTPATSFAEQTVIVTGSNTGLGKEAARHFAFLGAAKVILAVRNLKAGEEAKKDIEVTTKCDPAVIEVWQLDLSSYVSVKSFADRASNLPRLDVLLENAAIAPMYDFLLVEGHERTITINVISTFFLALLLLPKLKSSAETFGINPRIVVVSSEAHALSSFPEWKEPNTFDALDDKSKARMSERYSTSKLMEVLIVQQIAPKLEDSGVIVNMLNPGLCHSELSRDAGLHVQILKFFFARTTEVGSRTLVAAAAAGQESHGRYMHNGLIDDRVLSEFVKSEEGKKAAEKIWKELSGILETIAPGVTLNL
ncbi:short chain dehydrogenase sol3 [Dipodascopsis uninucleata]